MNIYSRIGLIATTLLCANTAFSQEFSLRGSTLTGDTFILSDSNQNFDVEVWFNTGAGFFNQVTGYTISLGFASANVYTQAAMNANSSPIALNGSYGSFDNTPPSDFCVTNHVAGVTLARSGAKRQGQANPISGNNNPLDTSPLRPYGILFSAIGQPNFNGNLGSGNIKIATIRLKAINLLGVFGDNSNETGLVVYRHQAVAFGNPSTTSGIGGLGTSNGKYGSMKYKVTATPEPATMIALIGGIAALANRRKKKA